MEVAIPRDSQYPKILACAIIEVELGHFVAIWLNRIGGS